MCTAVSLTDGAHYFGRNLDLERGYGERVVITPRRFPLPMRCMPPLSRHYAMIGMAAVAEGYPMYFDATNEKGLSMAGLNFPGNAVYAPAGDGANVSPFELIPWLLGRCGDVDEAVTQIRRVRLAAIPFSEGLPLTPLHWLMADRQRSVVVESVADGLHIYENPVGVLTNNPPFPYHLTHLNTYMALHEGMPEDRMAAGGWPEVFSLGMGAVGLPGDFSSPSRFVRAAFVRAKTRSGPGESEQVNRFFRILGAVSMPLGCVLTGGGEWEYTRYTSCCNTDRGVYYYTTYEDPTPRSVAMDWADPEGTTLYLHTPLA